MTAEAVCREVYQETQRFYAEREHLLGQAAHGFDILHGPPVVNAPFLFIGYQPGGTLENRPMGQPTQWPETCVYSTAKWPLARRLREMQSIPLSECTGLNAIFFRAPSAKQWSRVPDELRGEVEGFSLRQAERIARALAPQRIVFIGLSTFHMLTRGGIAAYGSKGSVLVRKGDVWGAPAFGIVHLSGARVSKEDRTRLNGFFADLA